MWALHVAEIIDKVKSVQHPPFRPHLTFKEVDPKEMVELMEICWKEDPAHRPSFEIIKEILRKMTKGK